MEFTNDVILPKRHVFNSIQPAEIN